MGRKQGIGGRSLIKSFSYPKDFDDTVEKIEEIAKREGSSFSEVTVELLKDYYKKHGESENAQTLITLYETGLENAIPNLYRAEEVWKKFYKQIKKKLDYKELDKQLNMILRIHNAKNKDMK